MANHVSAWIYMESNEAATRLFDQILKEIEQRRSQYDYGDVRPICSVLFGENGPMRHDDERLGGAKWVFAEEASDGQLSICSGWDPAFGVGNEIFRRLREIDPEVSVWMTFQDEMPNCVGAAVWGVESGSIKRADQWCELEDVEVVSFDEAEDLDEEELAEITTWDDVHELMLECLEAAKASVNAGRFGRFTMQRE